MGYICASARLPYLGVGQTRNACLANQQKNGGINLGKGERLLWHFVDLNVFNTIDPDRMLGLP